MKPTKFRNTYRIASARLCGWDYGRNAAYFITICTAKRIRHFGAIHEGEMFLSEAGQIAWEIWESLPNRFPFVQLDACVIMPDHVHGIIIINKTDDPPRRDAMNRVSECENAVKTMGGITGDHNPMLYDNLSRIIRWYKGRCTYAIRRTNPHFAWQSRFYDRIIHDGKALNQVRRYIDHNIANW